MYAFPEQPITVCWRRLEFDQGGRSLLISGIRPSTRTNPEGTYSGRWSLNFGTADQIEASANRLPSPTNVRTHINSLSARLGENRRELLTTAEKPTRTLRCPDPAALHSPLI